MKIYIPCKCGHYEFDHVDPVIHFDACERCANCKTVPARFNILNEEIKFEEEPEFICSGYKPMDGLEYIVWLDKQKVKSKA